MLSARTIFTGVAAAGIGYGGWKYSHTRKDFDTEDKLKFSASSVVAGTVAGAGLYTIGASRLATGAGAAYKAARGLGKAFTWNPLKSALARTGIKTGWSNLPKGFGGGVLKTVMSLTALGALAVGSTIATYDIPVEREDNATPDDMGYRSREAPPAPPFGQSIKERVGMMGASGDIVFGLNNTRHG